jgi:translation initiation factor 1
VSRKGSRLVYSTDPDHARRCPRCGRYPCRCPRPTSLPPAEQTARIRRERKGRRGKTVTVVADLQLTAQDLEDLGKQLRRLCGSGGTVKQGQIEIQGDHRERVAEELGKLGYKVKHAGG